MGSFLKWGNWAVAKMVELMFNTSHLSDVGCTYRLLRRQVAHKVAEELTVGGSELYQTDPAQISRFFQQTLGTIPSPGIAG